MNDSIPETGDDQQRLNNVKEKSSKKGIFSLSAKDHLVLGSTPPEELTKEPDKALYETMTDDQIEEYLELLLDFVYDPKFVKNGVAKIQMNEFLTGLSFLESVNRLPNKFKGFDLDELPKL